MNKYDFTLEELKKVMDGKASVDEIEKFYKTWSAFKNDGENILEGLESHLVKLDNNFSKAFPSAITAIESWFGENFPGKANKNYAHISPIVVAIYDLLLSLKRSYEHKSAMSCSVITRALFEARVNLAEISREPDKFSEQYTRYKEVAKIWHENKQQIIDEETLLLRLKNFPEWYDSNSRKLKNKRKSWTGIENDTISAMANRNNLEQEYKTLYSTTSMFVHISPLLGNYYSVQGYGPLCNEKGVFQISYLGMAQFIEAFVSALRIIGMKQSEEIYGILNIPLTIISGDLKT